MTMPTTASLSRLCIVTLLSLTLGACAGRSAFPLVPVADAASNPQVEADHDIFIATTRAKSDDPAYVYSGSRAEDGVSFARIDVTVPAVHQVGMIERSRNNKPDPARFFTPTQIALYKEDGPFRRDLDADIKKKGGRALVFIHGYNTSFDEAVYRTTQIVHDAKYPGTPVLFTWASAGRTLDYVYDSNSATVARDSLEQTLRVLADSGASRIDIIAHSMGTWLTMEALRQLAITNDGTLNGKLGDVILASPDIDIDVFRSQMRRYGTPKKPFLLLLSRDDNALRISGLIAGNRPRVGGYDDDAALAKLGVTVADLTEVHSADRLNHAKFADNPLLIQMLGEQLRSDGSMRGDNAGNPAGRVETFGSALGQTVASAASIVVTTPFEVFNVVLGQ
ncbi:alpha/beta hydrolase [Tianweitania sp.]|uniref:alpha/beta hydrolase n=1 Tax=Tianweitania sp. TaxID=2021634 RepID=UPI0028994CF1|nr:alpha/beta hydrolase [Tianweitania sp.]